MHITANVYLTMHALMSFQLIFIVSKGTTRVFPSVNSCKTAAHALNFCPVLNVGSQYEGMKEFFDTMMDSENKILLSDILSVLGMTMAGSGKRESLKYKLTGSKGQHLDTWGFEYIKNRMFS